MAEQLGKFVAPRIAAAPGSPMTGQMYYDTATNTLFYWNGTEWVSAKGSKGEKGEPGTAAGAFSQIIGDGSTKVFTIEHKLGVRAVLVGVRQTASPWQQVWEGILAEAISTTQVKITFETAPTTNQYEVVVQSGGGKEGPKGETGPPGSGVTKAEVEAIAILKALVTTKGDLIAASASATPTRLGVGADGARLIADAASTPGVKWGAKDYGVVTVLPTSPTPAKGDRCTYKAATGIYWDLIYTEEATYPWAKVGGPPLRAEDTTDRTTSGSSYLTTGAPEIVTPAIAGEYRCTFGAAVARKKSATAGDGGSNRVGLFRAAAEVSGASAWFRAENQDRGGPIYTTRTVTATASQAFQARYRNDSGIEGAFTNLFLDVDPIRVG